MIIDLGIKDGRNFEADLFLTIINERDKKLELHLNCYRVDAEGKEVKNEYTHPYYRTLIATNETWVNPATGDYVEEGTEGAMGEWDYFSYISANVAIKVDELKLSVINKNKARLLPA